ncbi:MAG: hypothetical protein ACLQNE_22115, partial [Thermoguttaceae bacterium]
SPPKAARRRAGSDFNTPALSIGSHPVTYTNLNFSGTNSNGSYTVQFDNVTTSGTLRVNPVTLTAAPGALTPPSATEGIAFSNVTVFHFSDSAGTYAKIGDYTAVVQLGDGNSVTSNSAGVLGTPPAGASGQIVADGTGYDVQLSYTYAEAIQASANKTFSVTVTDAGGAPAISASTTPFTVADAPLTAGALTPPGTTTVSTFASVTSPDGLAFDAAGTLYVSDSDGEYGGCHAHQYGQPEQRADHGRPQRRLRCGSLVHLRRGAGQRDLQCDGDR